MLRRLSRDLRLLRIQTTSSSACSPLPVWRGGRARRSSKTVYSSDEHSEPGGTCDGRGFYYFGCLWDASKASGPTRIRPPPAFDRLAFLMRRRATLCSSIKYFGMLKPRRTKQQTYPCVTPRTLPNCKELGRVLGVRVRFDHKRNPARD
jgi:hypothetical protein